MLSMDIYAPEGFMKKEGIGGMGWTRDKQETGRDRQESIDEGERVNTLRRLRCKSIGGVGVAAWSVLGRCS